MENLNNIDEAVSFLLRHSLYSQKKGDPESAFMRMKTFCGLLGNPQNSCPSVHVAGTSGKGSTSTFIASILGMRYKTGLYTSPHLVNVNERIKIIERIKDQKPKINNTNLKLKMVDIPDKDFVHIVNKVIPAISEMRKSKYGAPSYFEIMTAMAFLHFKMEKADIAVLEVGMGGRFDATNVITPIISVITSIGIDHTEYLGNTLEKIAREKAGIIKKGITVVSSARQKNVISVLKLKCKNRNAKIKLIGRDFKYSVRSTNLDGEEFDYEGIGKFNGLKTRMIGEHQAENAAVAVRTIEELGIQNSPACTGRDFRVQINEISEGISNAFIPGRFEIIKRKPLVILDGAHNEDKIKAIGKTVKAIFGEKKIVTLTAIKNDKDARSILKEEISFSSMLVLTEFTIPSDTGKICSYSTSELKDICVGLGFTNFITEKNLKIALECARKRGLPVLVTGSLYLAGLVRLETV